ncbi:MAG: hypothetical protein BGO69_09425 [Bacteroidetes bacterium 46-16]|nr:MAG: hypothetical protein BGO69_09425 [Bacteroidetes bacterium 46-16]
MSFLKNKQQPTYLHFLDRELRRAEDTNYSDNIILEALVIAVFNSLNYCYSSASLLQESNQLFPKSIDLLKHLEVAGIVHLLTNEHSFEEFIQSRRKIYADNSNRYPMYFDKADQTLWPTNPTFIQSSTTKTLKHNLLDWLNDEGSDINLKRRSFEANILKQFEQTLHQEKGKAITLDLLLNKEQLNNNEIRRSAGRVVSYFYTKRYLDLFNGDILCNLKGLTFYDILSSNPQLNDVTIIRKILNRFSIPSFFIKDNGFDIGKFIAYVTNPIFKEFQVELFSTIEALLTFTANETKDMMWSLRIFESINISESIDNKLQPAQHLQQSYILLSNITKILCNKHKHFDTPFLMAKNELSQNKRVLIVTTTKIEAQSFIESMTKIGRIPKSFTLKKLTFWNFGILNGSEILMLKLGDMGSSKTSGSTLIVKEAIDAIKFDFVIMLGIAFGLKQRKQRIGTILVSRELEDYESAKVSSDTTIQRGHNIPAGPTLLNRFDSASITYNKAEVEIGLFISGDKLVDDKELVDQLIKNFPEAIGGEMEGTGLQSSCHREQIEWIVIKGICDWGYNKDVPTKEDDQLLAIRNACDFFIFTLTQYPL